MAYFDTAKEWVILFPPDIPGAKKAAGDLSRCIGLLAAGDCGAGARLPPALADASGAAPPADVPIILLNSEDVSPLRNGFTWRAAPERVEIYGESGRGLCNGIYSFLAALGITWPAPGKEILPPGAAKTPQGFPLSAGSAYEPSRHEGENPAAAPRRRFVPAGKEAVRQILSKGEAFVEWAARRRYDAIVFPLAVFASGSGGRKLKEFRQFAEDYRISIEAGGRDLSSLVPRRFFFFHRDFFRMEGGRRRKAHHFCPTSPGLIRLMEREGGKLFRAAKGVELFHLWPDKGNETTWCSCPTCRAFSPSEQNRIGVNAAADILAAVNPGASVTFFEKSGADTDAYPGEGVNIPLRRNLFPLEKLPEEKEFPGDRKVKL